MKCCYTSIYNTFIPSDYDVNFDDSKMLFIVELRYVNKWNFNISNLAPIFYGRNLHYSLQCFGILYNLLHYENKTHLKREKPQHFFISQQNARNTTLFTSDALYSVILSSMWIGIGEKKNQHCFIAIHISLSYTKKFQSGFCRLV